MARYVEPIRVEFEHSGTFCYPLMLKTRVLLNLLLLVLLAFCGTTAWAQEELGYILGPEDVVTVTVVDQPKFSGEYMVPASGRIELPVAGEVTVTGMTLTQLRTVMTSKLKARLVKPEVVVSLKLARPQRIYVFGDVKAPGIFDLKPGWSIAETISAAGGVALGVESVDVTVKIEKVSGERLSLPLNDVLNGTEQTKVKLQAGDVIRLESALLVPIYVSGQVKTPGVYRMKQNEAGVLEAITRAGGVLDDANTKSVRIIRMNGKEESVDLTPVLLRGEKVELPKLEAGDMILISETQERFVIFGYVTKPGQYTIPSGQNYTLSQAVALAEGPDKKARLSRVGLLRVENGKETRKIYDLGKYLNTGDASMNPAVQPGDVIYVPENNTVNLSNILTNIASAALIFTRFR